MKRNFCLCIMFMMLLILPVSCGRNSDSPKVAMAAGNISDIDLPLGRRTWTQTSLQTEHMFYIR